MKFVKAFFVHDNGLMKQRWVNVAHIQEMDLEPSPLKVYDNHQKEHVFESVYSIRTTSEVPGYIDASSPFVTKEIDELSKQIEFMPKLKKHAR